ncbi:hypothetical protein BH23THE1_BH23THE1_15640 [soil metagenome]
MPAKLTTTVKNIDIKVTNQTNRQIINDFYEYLQNMDTSESYQNGLLKVLIRYAEYLGNYTTFYQIQEKEQILDFLDSKRKIAKEDPDKKWITKWNDYLWRLKYFYRWLYNARAKGLNAKSYDTWNTPDFINLKMKRTKRLSPYLETEIWDKDELAIIIKYDPYKRNKAILSLLWDLDARPHEITLLKINHIRLKEKYGEGEIPHEANTPAFKSCLLRVPYTFNSKCFDKINDPEVKIIQEIDISKPLQKIDNLLVEYLEKKKRTRLRNKCSDSKTNKYNSILYVEKLLTIPIRDYRKMLLV